MFDCHDWLSDKKRAVTLEPRVQHSETKETFVVTLHTEDARHAGTDANAFVSLAGTTGQFGPIFLEESDGGGSMLERNGVSVL